MATIDVEMLPTTGACAACGNRAGNAVAVLPDPTGQHGTREFYCANMACERGLPMLMRAIGIRGLA